MEKHLFHRVLQGPACSPFVWTGELTEETSYVTCKKCLDFIALWTEPVNMRTAYANREEDGSITIHGVQVRARECFLHDLPLPCSTCVAEHRAMATAFHQVAATPGAILTSLDHGIEDGYWVESKYRVEADGSRTLIDQRTIKPGESDAQ